MKIIMPNETLRRFHSPIKNKTIIFKTNGIGGFHHFPCLRHLDGVFEFNHCQFHLFDFNITLFHPNYFK